MPTASQNKNNSTMTDNSIITSATATNTVTSIPSVIIAVSQSVAKVFMIGCVGVLAVKFPNNRTSKKATTTPLLPAAAVGTVSRFVFHVLLIPLFYATIARSVSISSIGQYWFAIVSAFCVIAISYITATLLSYIFMIPTCKNSNSSNSNNSNSNNNNNNNSKNFNALRIASCFPNVVALPILLFASLCEYEIVYEAEDSVHSYEKCVDASNTMIFLYFFAWSVLFWSIGHPALIHAAANKTEQNSSTSEEEQQQAQEDDATLDNQSTTKPTSYFFQNTICVGIFQLLKSPGFLAMACGIFTACVPPLQRALFEHGGALRFLGSAAESLGYASAPLSTIVVAASLVPPKEETKKNDDENDDDSNNDNNDNDTVGVNDADNEIPTRDNGALDKGNNNNIIHVDKNIVSVEASSFINIDQEEEKTEEEDNNNHHHHYNNENKQHAKESEEGPVVVSSDPNARPLCHHHRHRHLYHSLSSSLKRMRHYSLRQTNKNSQRNSRFLHSNNTTTTTTTTITTTKSPLVMRQIHVWFLLSRLVVTPGIVVACIYGLDRAGFLSGVSGLAKLVTIINAALPGALVVVVVLKSNPELSQTASLVASVYLSSYLFSIVSIALWASMGLWIVSISSR